MDPDFPVGGAVPTSWGGGINLQHGVFFGRNVCKNERIGSRWGWGRTPAAPPGSTTVGEKCYSNTLYSKVTGALFSLITQYRFQLFSTDLTLAQNVSQR